MLSNKKPSQRDSRETNRYFYLFTHQLKGIYILTVHTIDRVNQQSDFLHIKRSPYVKPRLILLQVQRKTTSTDYDRM